jgi:hypothetical protein
VVFIRSSCSVGRTPHPCSSSSLTSAS